MVEQNTSILKQRLICYCNLENYCLALKAGMRIADDVVCGVRCVGFDNTHPLTRGSLHRWFIGTILT